MSRKPVVGRTIVKKLLLLFIGLATTSCFWGDEFETRHLLGHYYLDGIESSADSWYLHFEDEEGNLGATLINSYVAEAGFNEKCIVLRVIGPSPNYYLIPGSYAAARQDRKFARSVIVGPLDKAEFEIAVRRLNNGTLVPFDPEITSF